MCPQSLGIKKGYVWRYMRKSKKALSKSNGTANNSAISV